MVQVSAADPPRALQMNFRYRTPDSRPRAERAAQIIPHHNDYLAVIFTRGEAEFLAARAQHSPLLKMRLSVNSWQLQLDVRFRGCRILQLHCLSA
jgi:hypothetical protein